MRTIALLLASFAMATTVAAQSDSAWSDELPPLLPEAEEIALARSAAPDAVSADATVLVLRRGGYVVAREGGSGVTCYVSRTWPESLEPHCFDAEGAATILRMALERARLREEGNTREEIERAIADGIAAGAFRLPRRPAMSYMMSAGQVLFNDTGQRVGRWHPHLMIYVPYVTAAELGLGEEPSTDAAIVVDGGKPNASVMILVREFVEPKPQ